jgi:hypothetical protein
MMMKKKKVMLLFDYNHYYLDLFAVENDDLGNEDRD